MNASLEETAVLYVLDQLDNSARAVFGARLAREPELAAFVRELESGLAAGVSALPPQAPPTGLLGRIEVAIDADAESGRTLAATIPTPDRETARASGSGSPWRWLNWAQWGIAAVIAVSLATLAVQSLRRPAAPTFVVVGMDATRATLTELRPSGAATQDPDARFVQLAALAQDFWRNPQAVPVAMPAGAGSAGNRGYAIFDPASRQGFLAVEQLPAIAANQRYHLWVADTTTGRVQDAGILPLAGVNRGLYSFRAETTGATPPARLSFFVTLEDAAAGAAQPATQPRGKVVLGKESI